MVGPILRRGKNCFASPLARRARILIDAAAYFGGLEESLRRATRSILILGWDFDARIRLLPGDESPPDLGQLLRELVETHPELEIRVLVWNLAAVYGPGAATPLVVGSAWHEHPRIHVRLDNHHPLYAAQHQKIVCVDGRVSFVGGIDLTVMRWDTAAHLPSDQCRRLPDGTAYGPVHDLQIAVDGEAARTICAIAAERWLTATGEALSNLVCESDPWPRSVAPDFFDIPIGIARTVPKWAEVPGCREIEALNVDAIGTANETVYIETQYLAESRVVDAPCARLAAERGPEVILLVTRATHGILEKWIMGGNRNRMIRRLRRADRFKRLRVFYPVVSAQNEECEVLVHSKLVIVDDRFVRVGSSNISRRSMGLDTELDLAIESQSAETSKTIRSIRTALISEHLGTTCRALEAAIRAEQSLVTAVDRLNGGPRRLESFRVGDKGPAHLMPGTRLLDPREPFRLFSHLRRRRHAAQRLR